MGQASKERDEKSDLSPIDLQHGSAYEAAKRVQIPKATPKDYSDLHNVYQLSENIFSGSEPHGEEAIRRIKEMGVKTILSVDGKEPDAELAAKYGMKYVHVPIQYKGINKGEILKIAKTFREQEGPFFVHCFHGKHRGPAAAEIGRLVLDGITREQALAEMKQCGTASQYEGLYKTIATAPIPGEETTKRYDWDFPAAHPLDGIAGAMTAISRADDHLKALSKRKWEADPHHPDIDPFNEAVKLLNAFERSAKMEEVLEKPADYRKWMEDSITASRALRDAVKAVKAGTGKSEAADAAYKSVVNACNSCHEVYRNQ